MWVLSKVYLANLGLFFIKVGLKSNDSSIVKS